MKNCSFLKQLSWCSLGVVVLLWLTGTANATQVVGWALKANGKTNVPAALNDAVSIAAGADHSLALRADGLFFNPLIHQFVTLALFVLLTTTVAVPVVYRKISRRLEARTDRLATLNEAEAETYARFIGTTSFQRSWHGSSKPIRICTTGYWQRA